MRSEPRRPSGEATTHKLAPAIRRAEALLLVAGVEAGLRGAEPDLEHVRRVGPRRVRLVLAAAAPGGRAPEFARLDHARAPHGIVVGERAAADVGDDLGVATGPAREVRARRQAVLVEDLEGAETIRQRVGPILRVEGEPDLVLAAAVVVALLGSAQRDHRATPPSDSQRSSGSSPGAVENVTVNTPASSAARICLSPLLASGKVNARVKPA